MPLVAFRPTKARLVLEQSRENVLMLKILVATGETVSLASGGTLESLAGLMRIRERKDERGRGNDEALGSITYVDATVEGQRRKAANFHIDIALSSTQFDALLKVAVSGRLPAKLFAQIGERVSARETKGLVYLIQGATKVKFWNNRRNPTLPVTNFSVILPIDVPELMEPSESMEPGEAMERMEPIEPIDTDLFDEEHSPAESLTGTLKIAELADEFTVFRAETKNTLTAIVSVVAVIGILLLVINLVLILR
jgi:hypothetical protein